jgi:hypothetical protein
MPALSTTDRVAFSSQHPKIAFQRLATQKANQPGLTNQLSKFILFLNVKELLNKGKTTRNCHAVD